MSVTSRLYYDDPTLLAFTATVLACEPAGQQSRVSLDRTAFYPTSGGQPHDLGYLRDGDRVVPVVDVIADEAEQVWHLVAQPIAPGTPVAGEIDAARRHTHRQQHSAQHILSAAFDALFDNRTESVHLGLGACTLDLQREVTADECRRAEDYANAAVWDNRPVTVRYADAQDLASEPRLRKATTRTGRIRLIDIAAHDLSACGGTHVAATGEVGLIVIRGTERFRGGTRVSFVAGQLALESYRQLRDSADAAARVLSVPIEDVPVALARLREDLKHEQRRARELGEQLNAIQVEAMESRVDGSGLLVAHLPDADAQALRLTASRLVSTAGRVVALLGGEPPHALVVARSADRVDVDAGALVRTICAAHGGKGGGRPDFAQAGGVSASPDALRLLLG